MTVDNMHPAHICEVDELVPADDLLCIQVEALQEVLQGQAGKETISALP